MANWIKNAIKKPGALHEYFHVEKGENIPDEKIDKKKAQLRAKSENGNLSASESTLLRRLNLATTLGRMRK